ncbi:MAG: hypothetical protein GWO83_00085 [Bacteroidia bacterium]|nr:hypothetical protein [Bacteroidia bacterium]
MVVHPRYPAICVESHSHNPLALVAAVREAMRLAHVENSEISRFSDQALTAPEPRRVREVCRSWVIVDENGHLD